MSNVITEIPDRLRMCGITEIIQNTGIVQFHFEDGRNMTIPVVKNDWDKTNDAITQALDIANPIQVDQ